MLFERQIYSREEGQEVNNHGCFCSGLSEGQAVWSYRRAAEPSVLCPALGESQNSSKHFTLPSNSTVLQPLPFSSVISLRDSKQNLNRSAVIPQLKLKLNKSFCYLTARQKTPTCSGSELFQCNKQQALVEMYCKLILQVCFHSLYIINLHENGANPSKGFKLLWDQNNVASYNLKQQCTSKW